MSDTSSSAVELAIRKPRIPPRGETQRRLDQLSDVATEIEPQEHYSLGDRIEAVVDGSPDRPFLVYGGDSFSYRECDERINQYANALVARGVKSGDVCAIAFENRPDMFFCWFALAKIGAITALVSYHLSGATLIHVVERTSAKVAIVGEECVESFVPTPEDHCVPVWLVPDPEKPAGQEIPARFDTSFVVDVDRASRERPGSLLRSGIRAKDDMLYIFTSGTTGLPKAAKYSHMHWMTCGDVLEETIDAAETDVFYCCFPLDHGAAATSVISTALASGASIVMRREFSDRKFWGDVGKYGITVFQYSGEVFKSLLKRPLEPRDRTHSLRCMLGSGSTTDNWRLSIERFGDLDVFQKGGAWWGSVDLLRYDSDGYCYFVDRVGRTQTEVTV